MKKKEPMEQLLQALNDYTTSEGDVVPDGWFTIREIMDKTGLKYDTAKKKLSGACRKGMMQKKFFRVIHTKGQGPQRTLFYKAL